MSESTPVTSLSEMRFGGTAAFLVPVIADDELESVLDAQVFLTHDG